MKEHREYAVNIDKLNDLGNAFDSLSRPETPTRRRNTASPTKRMGLGAPYGNFLLNIDGVTVNYKKILIIRY